MILGIETSCDETAAAVVTGDGRVLSSVVASQAELHARYGGVVPEVASRRHLELVGPVVREALDEAGVGARRRRPRRRHPGPGPDRRAARRPLRGEGDRVGAAASRSCPVDHLHGHVASLYLGPEPVEPPFVCLLASGGHTLLLDVREHGAFERLGTTLDDAAGEAFDKGARLLGLGYPGGAAIDGSPARATRPRSGFPSRACPGSTSPSPGSRPRCSTPSATSAPDELEARRADLAASYQRAIVLALTPAAARGRRADRASSGSPSSAAWPPTPSCARALPERRARAARALHRQRGDDRLRRAVRRSRLPCRTRSSWMRMRRLPERAAPGAPALGAPRRASRCSSSRGRAAPTSRPPRRPGGRASSATGPRRSSATAGSSCSRSRRSPRASPRRAASRPRSRSARWTAEARRDQRDVLARLAFHGAPIEPEHSLHAGLQRLRRAARRADARDRRSATPTCRASTRCAPSSRRRADRVDGLARRRDGAAGRRRHPGLHGRGRDGRAARHRRRPRAPVHPRGARCRGIDVLDPTGDASARQNPTVPGRPERHGTEMAGLVAGSGGPAGLHGVAPGATLLPIRVAGWQPDASGGVSVYGRTDQLLAGIELAVDPNERRRRARRRPRRRSSASSSRSPRSPTGPLAARGRGSAARSTRSSSRRPATTARPARPTAASAAPAALRPPSPSARSTRGSAARPGTCCCSPGLAHARLGRAAARRRRRPGRSPSPRRSSR